MTDSRLDPTHSDEAAEWDVTAPAQVADYRSRLSTGEHVIDPENWAGRLPASAGIPPRVRIGRKRWLNLLWLLPVGFLLILIAVAVAQGLRDMPVVQRFIARYPGTLATSTAQGGHSRHPHVERVPRAPARTLHSPGSPRILPSPVEARARR
jgi:methionine sulfoxide reductase catalytic subunit